MAATLEQSEAESGETHENTGINREQCKSKAARERKTSGGTGIRHDSRHFNQESKAAEEGIDKKEKSRWNEDSKVRIRKERETTRAVSRKCEVKTRSHDQNMMQQTWTETAKKVLKDRRGKNEIEEEREKSE
ncbi:hypothetical protein C8R44DRAFT_729317 [Mycena epipterygia]|nr:hypothetical protein C8R44DRAFT_729317 [Mycena epipterygia]